MGRGVRHLGGGRMVSVLAIGRESRGARGGTPADVRGADESAQSSGGDVSAQRVRHSARSDYSIDQLSRFIDRGVREKMQRIVPQETAVSSAAVAAPRVRSRRSICARCFEGGSARHREAGACRALRSFGVKACLTTELDGDCNGNSHGDYLGRRFDSNSSIELERLSW